MLRCRAGDDAAFRHADIFADDDADDAPCQRCRALRDAFRLRLRYAFMIITLCRRHMLRDAATSGSHLMLRHYFSLPMLLAISDARHAAAISATDHAAMLMPLCCLLIIELMPDAALPPPLISPRHADDASAFAMRWRC